ncbi:Hypothetical protein NTJ_07700 [Nesidiocoris tenuis]|uniref:Uncharacterized protein n=1 Tax=Nesidiocoris tenuis TaxID=355587 RepID=A0ABN7AVI8_9HEMI|nr:Hypothetical protein NTJ_07700 [Nesidiocoris tenuis]
MNDKPPTGQPYLMTRELFTTVTAGDGARRRRFSRRLEHRNTDWGHLGFSPIRSRRNPNYSWRKEVDKRGKNDRSAEKNRMVSPCFHIMFCKQVAPRKQGNPHKANALDSLSEWDSS